MRVVSLSGDEPTVPTLPGPSCISDAWNVRPHCPWQRNQSRGVCRWIDMLKTHCFLPHLSPQWNLLYLHLREAPAAVSSRKRDQWPWQHENTPGGEVYEDVSQCEDLDILMTMSHQLKSLEEEGESSTLIFKGPTYQVSWHSGIGEAVSRGMGRHCIWVQILQLELSNLGVASYPLPTHQWDEGSCHF